MKIMERKPKTSEKYFEKLLRTEVEKMGGKAVKLYSEINTGLPDRMIMLPGGKIFFVELKSTGKKPTKLQELVHKEFRELGFDVYVADSVEGVTSVVTLCRLYVHHAKYDAFGATVTSGKPEVLKSTKKFTPDFTVGEFNDML